MPAPEGWRPVTVRPLVVLVGVTGVGKSTALTALASSGLQYHLLPDRRFLADQIIIPAMQAVSGDPIGPVTDRRTRFAYTRRYAEQYRGGTAHALAQLQIDPEVHGRLLIFDGLRGADEVGYALAALPLARFVVLEAPDAMRVARLMGRQDPFDRIAAASLLMAPALRPRCCPNSKAPATCLLTLRLIPGRSWWPQACFQRPTCAAAWRSWSRNAATTTRPRPARPCCSLRQTGPV